MGVKKIRIAPDLSSTFVTLPGSTGGLTSEAGMIDDTIFGQNYKSEMADMITWSVSANAVYKGYAGYAVVIKATAAPIVMTDEACSLVSGKTYQITSATKQLIDPGTAVVVEDNGVDQTANVLSIDYLFGTVTFKSTYTVTGPVTITGAYMPASQVCAMNKYTLNMQANAIDQTDLCTAQTNGGMKQFIGGLKSVSIDLKGFYKPTSTFLTALKARTVMLIEINPDGAGKAVARGFFVTKTDKESGKVGDLEAEEVSFSLYVPDIDLMSSPFSWVFNSGCTLNTSVQTLLAAYATGAQVQVQYLEDGTTGKQGNAIPVDMSLSGGMGALNEFSVKLTGTGGLTLI